VCVFRGKFGMRAFIYLRKSCIHTNLNVCVYMCKCYGMILKSHTYEPECMCVYMCICHGMILESQVYFFRRITISISQTIPLLVAHTCIHTVMHACMYTLPTCIP
jgi:hypothetical protein